MLRCSTHTQWWRQRSKGARLFRRSENPPARSPECTFFPEKKLTFFFFSCRPQNAGRQRRFTVKIKQIERSDFVTVLFSVRHPKLKDFPLNLTQPNPTRDGEKMPTTVLCLAVILPLTFCFQCLPLIWQMHATHVQQILPVMSA